VGASVNRRAEVAVTRRHERDVRAHIFVNGATLLLGRGRSPASVIVIFY